MSASPEILARPVGRVARVALALGATLFAPALASAQDTDSDGTSEDSDPPERRKRRGLVDDEAIIKWSAHTLEREGWVVGLNLVAHGLTDDLTLGVRASDVVLGHYNARVRARLGHNVDRVVSLDAGAGLVTPLGIAFLAVPSTGPPSPLAMVDVGLPITWTLATGRFVTVRPWLALSAGRVDHDERTLPLILGRAALTGPGVQVIAEGHLAPRIGVVGSVDVGLELFGGDPAFASTTRIAMLLATGPVRANLGFGLVLGVDRTGSVTPPTFVPAIDIWVRF